MPIINKPEVIFPENKIDQTDTINFIEDMYPHHPDKELVLKMIKNTEVNTRHIVKPLREVLTHSGLSHRSVVYEEEGRKLSEKAARKAMENADIAPEEIDMIVVTSCTGFMMPSLTAHLINVLELKQDTIQLPIAQMGCVAGASAINRAFDFCRANDNVNILVVTLEFSSLCFQPSDAKLQSLVSDALFGDAVAAVVIRGGNEGKGFNIQKTKSFFIKNTEDYIKYDVKDTGFHFSLCKDVMHSIKHVAPVIEDFNQEHFGNAACDNDFYIFHTGGRKIIDELVEHLKLKEEDVQYSRESLYNAGNISSVAVLDVLSRQFKNPPKDQSKGILAAFGPGFTAEMAVGQWQ